jgi:choline dehydrogenase
MDNDNVRIEYDYVVVGSGAGGGPLAANLVKKGYRVLVLEAGRDGCEEVKTQAPLLHPASTEDDRLRWNFYVKHFTKTEEAEKDEKYQDKIEQWGNEPERDEHPVPIEDRPKKGDTTTSGVLYPRFSALGGCTAHNAMITVAPHNSDWDRIADLTKDESWRPDNMRKYWERFERCDFGPAAKLNGFVQALFAVFNIPFNPQRRGYSGYITISKAIPRRAKKDKKIVRLLFEILEQFVEEGKGPLIARLVKLLKRAAGRNFDPNHWTTLQNREGGVAITPLMTERGQRKGPREYLLKTQKQHPENLVIRTNCLATRILFDGNRAAGIEFVDKADLYDARRDDAARPKINDEDKQAVYVRREVILACGTFNTPQLLMLSGIGPKKQLEAAGYNTRLADVSSNPDADKGKPRPSKLRPIKYLKGVGRNLQDRYEVGVVTRMKEDFSLLRNVTLTDSYTDPQFQLWSRKRKGVYTSNGAVVGVIRRSKDNKLDPDLYIFGLAGFFKGYYPGYSNDGLKDGRRNWFTWAVLKGHTKNQRGYVELNRDTPKNPQSVPEINFRYFDDEDKARDSTEERAKENSRTYDQLRMDAEREADDDLDSIVEGVNYVRRLNQDPQMREILDSTPEALPGAAIDTEEKLRDYCKHQSWGHHASCTCPIGPEEPSDVLEFGGALDSNFKVHGVKNLRVVDATVFPRIPGLFILSAIYMISEKATDAILEDAVKPETFAHATDHEIEKEEFQKDEEVQIQRIIGTLRAKLARDYTQRTSLRDTHPKSNGLLRAKFRVLPNLPAQYKVGLFAEGHVKGEGIKAFIRYSNSAPEFTPDYEPDFRGIGLKLVGLDEHGIDETTLIKADDPNEEDHTQDFLLLATPQFFAANPKDFADFFETIIRGRVARILTPVLGATTARRIGLFTQYFLAKGRFRQFIAIKRRGVFASPLEIEWFGIAPFRFGAGNVVKYKIRPRDDQPRSPLLKKKKLTPDYLRQRMTEQLNKPEGYILDFLVQFRKEEFADKMKIEDTSIPWSEKHSQFVKVAEIVIPQQEFNSLQKREFDENLSFNPWHTREPHRPLGAINRARRFVMKALSDFRLMRNGEPRIEPTPADWDYFESIDSIDKPNM